jgi:uncharacterized protein YbjT (DUF2867 family)
MVLITGASGRVGRRTAELLASEGRPLRLMTRTPQRVPRLVHAEVVYGDFAEPASLDSAFASVTTALVVSGFAEPGKRARLHRNAFEAAASVTKELRLQHFLDFRGVSVPIERLCRTAAGASKSRDDGRERRGKRDGSHSPLAVVIPAGVH